MHTENSLRQVPADGTITGIKGNILMDTLTVTTDSPEQTRSLGIHLGRLACGDEIYLLTGNLGTGKTHLVQGIGFGLGVKEYACSPSFMIAREYHGRLTLYHLDLYRLDQIEEIVDLGIDQYFSSDALCAIEWAEKGSGVLPGYNLTVEMEHLGGDNRRITFIPHGEHYNGLVTRLKDALMHDSEVKWNFQ
jgi:tRNA threonylcarbamoyladenosine biosynthesis protein TsaE